MLRVNSLIYIEKLWSTPIIEEVEEEEQVDREVTGYGSIETNQKDTILTKEIREDVDQETSDAYDVDREVVEIHIPEQIDEVDEEEEEQIAEVTEQVTNALEQVVDAANEPTAEEELEQETKKEGEEIKKAEEEIKKVEDEPVKPKESEELKIDTKFASDTAVLIESPVEEVAHNQSNISSASSIPIVTPTSSQSTPTYSRHETVVTPRPRKTSLLRRETDKFNDRRKSLTKKLRKALTVDLK